MNQMFFLVLFILSSAGTVFLFLLSLRKLGSTIKNYSTLFAGFNHLILSVVIEPLNLKIICLIVGIFITAFSFIKIIRKMD